MKFSLRSFFFSVFSVLSLVTVLLLFPSIVFAVRNSRIDEAEISEEGKIIIEYGQDSFEETSALETGRDVASYFNFGYALTKRLELRFKLLKNDLSGGDISFNPIFSDLTSADGWGIEFKILLDETKAVLPTAESPQFQPGSAFAVALGATAVSLESPTVDSDLNSFYGRVLYSTDFSPELRAHTLFALSHFTSDFRRGNSTTIGLGADYDLLSLGKNGKLQLTANGLMDIISIRKPVFDTGRVTRFDAGLRISLNELVSGYAGWAVINDSFTDTNSQGFFYGVALTPTVRPARAEKKKAEEKTMTDEAPPEGEAEKGASESTEAQTTPMEPSQPEPPSGEQTKGTSMLRGQAPGISASPIPSEADAGGLITLPSEEAQGNLNGYHKVQAHQPLIPTTSERIVRPPPIENPWELLPIGYDFHPLVVEIKEAQSAEASPRQVDELVDFSPLSRSESKDSQKNKGNEEENGWKVYSYF